MVELSQERDLETLRQISLLLDRENQRLITKTLELTAELARLQGLNPEQLRLGVLQDLQQRRARAFQATAAPTSDAAPTRPPSPGHGPRPQPTLPVVEIRHEL